MIFLSFLIVVFAILTIYFGTSSAAILSSELKSHTSGNNYDITAIYKLKKTNDTNCHVIDGLFVSCRPHINQYEVEIKLGKNAIGMPIAYDGEVLNFRNKDFEFIADGSNENMYKYIKDDRKYYWLMDHSQISDSEYDEDIGPSSLSSTPYTFASITNTGDEILSINWKSSHTTQVCISVSYVLKNIYYCTMSLEIIDKDDLSVVVSYSLEQTNENLKTLVFRTNETFWKNVEYELRLHIHNSFQVDKCIGLKRIVQCLKPNEYEEVYTGIPMKTVPSQPGIYPFEGRTNLNFHAATEQTCNNGGIYVNNKCACPPGFRGDNCTKACGPNKYGKDCSGMCSTKEEECKGMIMCTDFFKCECSTGYTGEFCEYECPRGYYGFGCKQTCSENCLSGECNIFTGTCTKGCKNGYIMPNCIERYPWLLTAPKLISSDMDSMTLNLDLSQDNIGGGREKKPTYYQIMYKADSSESEFQYTDMKNMRKEKNITEIIDGLKLGTLYIVGAVLISEDGNFNEEIKTSLYATTCEEPKNISYELKLSNNELNSISATWKKHNRRSENECKINYYNLTLFLNDKTVSENKLGIDSNVYNFTKLIPGYLYTVQIKAHTALGLIESKEMAHMSTKPHGDIMLTNIVGKVDDFNKSIRLKWELVDSNMKAPLAYTIKYKANRYFSCSRRIVESNWTIVNVYNRFEYEILDLVPNTQYIVNVEPSINSESQENTIFVKTPLSTPNLAPVMNENQSIYVTNQTAKFKWNFDKNDCTKLNGFFSGYHLILKNLNYDTETVNDTKKNTVEYVDLDPDTNYEIQIYITTNNGFDPNYMLSVPFKTKSKFLSPVDDLTVYKKDSRHRAVSLRWGYPEDADVQGFMITITKDNVLTTFKEIRANKEKCTGWPNFYCTTVSSLMPKDQYTFMVKAVSEDYPEGGLPASVSCNFIDGFSDEPGNLRATRVGSNNITLEWDIPWIFNGVLKSFIVNMEEITALDMETCCASLPDVEINVTQEIPTYNCTLTNLKSGSTYSIGVLSKTSWYGQANRIFVTTLANSTREISTTTEMAL
ncbi:uncharacterized protein LOC126833056 [Adelges cooleyi]|uniref:uncharacterized protein LOC126833056 n=1 Tax=Adelges cooleyi TaxID=133065 RepID=UPI002180598D|nr:uncharacterized protein LOC126833056 [Adelges cooleyi]